MLAPVQYSLLLCIVSAVYKSACQGLPAARKDMLLIHSFLSKVPCNDKDIILLAGCDSLQ